MYGWVYIDTRKQGALSKLMDGLFHILPRESERPHDVDLACWCEPRVIWSPEAGTAIVSHWRVEPANTYGAR